MNTKSIFSLLFLIILTCTSLSGIDYYSPENIYRFAEYLYNNGDYLRAAGEYQRYLFTISENRLSLSDTLLFRIGLCYQFGGDTQKAIDYYDMIIRDSPKSNFSNRAQYQIAYTYFEMGKYKESVHYIEDNIESLSLTETHLKMNRLLGVNCLYQRKWKAAHYHFKKLLSNSGDSLTAKLNKFAIKGEHLPYKSKIFAGLMSATIPGTGKVYANRLTDGLYSLIVIGLTGWQAYNGFHKDGIRSTKGWIYGSLCGIFYLGNIYGSTVVVKIYNKKIEDNLLMQINIELNWR